ncbi:hypothetical protein N7462_007934 [Penicillium macrosclerotiorum]|uniref:uncharacterized protein n=1 Tax=Penicillium macrosclerotiorum TaxID=303699 RepID=UPI002547CBA7|nr:uncharacterized protein N7462_007934 [Penicillium macrosclerotiorum]KAJ5679690.1 hypothetical protein N7462_007934 [Penicillium macrosclerotiorum]
MFRARRYRVLTVFAAVFLLTLLHFSRSRDWREAAIIERPAEEHWSADSNVPTQQKPPTPEGNLEYAPPSVYQPAKPAAGSGTSGSGTASSSEKVASPKVDAPKTEPSKANSPIAPESDSNADKPNKGAGTGSSSDAPLTMPSDTEKTAPSTPQTELSLSEEYDASYPLNEEIDHGGTGRMSAQEHPGGGPRAYWKKTPDRFPVSAAQLIKLPKEPAKQIPRIQAKPKDESSADKQERLQQLSAIKAEFKHAWDGYKKAAMGHDEVKPLTEMFEDPFNGWGATLVDSLDTLWIMEMKDEFAEAVDAVKKIDFTTSPREDIPIFETVIRYLGGLLGAYDISGQRYSILLEKAQELAEILIGAFDTPNRMPVLYYRWTPEHTVRPHRASAKAVLAEIGSLSLEFTRLAQLTKEDKYYDAIARITNELEKIQDSTNIPGLWPLRVNAQGCSRYHPTREVGTPTQAVLAGKPSHNATEAASATTTTWPHKRYAAPTDLESYLRLIGRDDEIDFESAEAEPAPYYHASTQDKSSAEGQELIAEKCDGGLELPLSLRDNRYGLGGLADSTYEYLPKEYMLLGGLNDQYKKMYKKAMDAARRTLLFQPMVKGKHDLRFMATTGSLDPSKPGNIPSSKLEYEGTHLTCFLGGMVAMGAKAFNIDGDLDLATKLTDGCVWAYGATNTGIMPEKFRLLPCSKDTSCEWDEKLYQADVKRYSHVRDSEAEARFRTGESAYGQRVRLNADNKPQGSSEDSMVVPLPMPGSTNPHDYEPAVYKRDSFAVGRAGAAPSATPLSKVADTETIEDRDSPRPPFVSQAEGNEINDRLPAGMTSISAPEYLLRPEAIESVFIMFRVTGDDAWRKKGWTMFQAIAKHTRTNLAHAAIKDVTSPKPSQKDSMESFWTAETLKYFYLLFSDPSVVDLDKYVLNTEAHPLQRPIS